MWDTAIQKKFKIIAIDRPGFGFSGFGQALHLQEQSTIILPVLKSLKSKKPMYLCGHSMGGPMVVQLSAMAPDLFETIIINAGALDPKQEKTETWRKIINIRPLYYFLPGAFAPSNTELLYLKEDLIPLQNEFKKITCNVHFIHGDLDKWVPIQNIEFGMRMMTNAKQIKCDTIKGAGHLIPWKNEKEFTSILLNLY